MNLFYCTLLLSLISLQSSTNIDNYNQFTWNTYMNISNAKDFENICISPFSIYNALTMLSLGTNHNSQEQLYDILGIDNVTNTAINGQLKSYLFGFKDLKYAVQLFPDNSIRIKEQYLSKIYDIFEVNIQKVDFKNHPFKAVKRINSWVEKMTDGMIKNILRPELINLYTRLVVTNAVSMNKDFKYKFDSSLTKDEEFNVEKDVTIKVPMMRHKHISLNYNLMDESPLIELPYANSKLVLYILMPKSSIYKFENTIDPDKIMESIKKMKKTEMSFSMPKFNLSENLELTEILKIMGVSDIFNPSRANFSRMILKKVKYQHFYVSSLTHGASIEVNENGTKAASATVAVISNRMAKRVIKVEINRPFIYFIKDTSSDVIHFMGRYIQPYKSMEYRSYRRSCSTPTYKLSFFCVLLATVIKLLTFDI